MNIVFYPPKSSSNDYIQQIVKSLESKGINVCNSSWNGDFILGARTLLSKKKTMPKIMHLNWIEENANDSSFKAKVKCKLLISFFKLYKNKGGKIIWTMHNAKSHNPTANDQTKFIQTILSLTDLVMVHNNESKAILMNNYGYPKEKIFFVPIGNYSKTMCLFDLQKDFTNRKPIFLYFGTISYYKGIKKLLEVFNDAFIQNNAELYVCGKVSDQKLEDDIIRIGGGNKSIHLNLTRISDEELAKHFRKAAFAIFPFEKESMQNSSSAIMALTCATPIIIPLFGYIKDISNKSFVKSYDYNNEKEQISELKEKVIESIEMYLNDKSYLLQISNEAKIFAEKELDWDLIGNEIVKHYKILVKD